MFIFRRWIKNGEKTGKGKIYEECSHLIFEENLENGIKQGKGKVYNYSGDIIFEGEFDKDKEIKGKRYTYNDQGELIIYENEEGESEVFIMINNYISNIINKNCTYWKQRKLFWYL